MGYLRSAEEQYNDLVDTIFDVYVRVVGEHPEVIDPIYMLNRIASRGQIHREYYESVVEWAQRDASQLVPNLRRMLTIAAKKEDES